MLQTSEAGLIVGTTLTDFKVGNFLEHHDPIMACFPKSRNQGAAVVPGSDDNIARHAVFDLGGGRAMLVSMIPERTGKVIGWKLVLIGACPPAVDGWDEALQLWNQHARIIVLRQDKQGDIVLLGVHVQPVNVQVGDVHIIGNADLMGDMAGGLIGRTRTACLRTGIGSVETGIRAAIQVILKLDPQEIARLDDISRARNQRLGALDAVRNGRLVQRVGPHLNGILFRAWYNRSTSDFDVAIDDIKE